MPAKRAGPVLKYVLLIAGLIVIIINTTFYTTVDLLLAEMNPQIVVCKYRLYNALEEGIVPSLSIVI